MEEEKEKKYAYDVSVNLDDLINKRKLIGEKYEELVVMFKNYQNKLDETKRIYDTGSANYFRKVADEYIKFLLIKMNTDFKPYIDNMDNIISAYKNYNKDVSTMIEKGDNNGTA